MIKKILISQPEPSIKTQYVEFMEKYNVSIDFKPLIKVEGISAKNFRAERINILDHTAVVFTSKAAIDSFFHLCEELRIAIPETMKYFCTTEAVALYLQKHIIYRKRKIFPGTGTIKSIIDAIGNKHKNEKFLLALSDNYKPEIPQAFENAKLKYTNAILLNTVYSNIKDIDINQYDIMVFYTPTDIKSLLDNFPDFKQEKTLFATFGPATAKSVKEAGYEITVEAPTPEAPSILQALTLYMEKQK